MFPIPVPMRRSRCSSTNGPMAFICPMTRWRVCLRPTEMRRLWMSRGIWILKSRNFSPTRRMHNLDMEYRQLGHSGLKVSALSFGAGTFGGGNEFFRAWGDSGVEEATRLVDVCLEAGINLFDTADVYSNGLSEEVLGKAV